MTATDELRRMLDELRKLACDINEKEIRSHSVITLNHERYNRQFRLDMNHDWLNAWHAEFKRILQAIAATLGNEGVVRSNDGVAELEAGTCHETMIDRFFRGCSECGYMWEYMYGIGRRERPNYCPNCGAKVVDDG